jgi:NADPH:quinone reductase-like Zn-dependent oxidoreductase
MKAWILPAGSSELALVDLPSRAPGETDLKIRMRGWSVNFRDGGVAKGPVQRDTIPLSDGAGEVIEIGSRVTRFKIGDRVAGTFFQNWIGGRFSAEVPGSDLGGPIDGVLAEEVILPEQGVVRVPDHLSYAEAACLPCAGVTAWNALFEIGRTGPGKTVLLLGTGGVSIFALQLAKMAGTRVIITSSSDDKLARALALGADETVNYRDYPDWEKEVLSLTGERGVDLVLEVGGPGTMPKSLASVASGGTIVVIGAVGGRNGTLIDPLALIRRSIRLQGVFVGSRLMFEAMNQAVEARKLAPVIDRIFSFAEAPAAYAHQASGTHFGKVAIG